MLNYQDGKIYTIRNYTDNTLIYVGSTIDTLSRRLAKHRIDCKANKSKITLYSHIVNNDWANWYIELYEYYSCNNRTELERREGQVIREIGTINKCIAGRTKKEYQEENADFIKEYHKAYREDNKETISQKAKEWYEDNKEKVSQYHKKWYKDNKEEIIQKAKEYYKKNAEKIVKKKSEQVCCDICSAFSTKQNLKRHQQTKKCMNIASKN